METPERESLLDAAYAEEADDDALSIRLLDAAYEQFSRLGIRRTTMDDVARSVGVSRITVYRRFANKDALVQQVVRREFRRYFEQFVVDIQHARTAADRVVIGFVSSVQAIRHNPLIGEMMAVDPDPVIASMTTDGGGTFSIVQRFVASRLRLEQAAGTIGDHVDVELVAELMVRTAASFLLFPSQIIDIDDDRQLELVARRFLVPMLDPPASQ